MTTLEEFRGTVKEFREKLNNPNNTPQKNQALLQYIKDFCAHTLELPQLDQQFEREVKDTLFSTEQQLAQYKGKAPMTYTSDSATLPSTKPTSTPQAKSGTHSEDYISPSETAPLSLMMDSIMPSVPVSGFDPNSSPILRRLKQGKSIHESLIKSKGKPEAKPESTPNSNTSEIPATPEPKIGTEETAISTDEAAAPSTNNFFEATPFPQGLTEDQKPEPQKVELKNAYVDIPQLNTKIDLINIPINWLGRQDFSAAIKTPLPSDFLDPIISRTENGSGVKAHFTIEQPNSGEFWLKDPANFKQTYYKSGFVDPKGVKLADGDGFILPVKINNQIASLNVVFHIKK